MSAMAGELFFNGRVLLYTAGMLLFLGLAIVYRFARLTPKRIVAQVSEEKRPAWRCYETASCLVLAGAMLVLLCTELSLQGACAVRGGTAFWVRCGSAAVLILTVIVDLFVAKRFTRK